MIEVTGGSLLVAANKFLLTVDPISHTFRSSGEIISKIDKSIESLKLFFFTIIDSFIPVITSLVTIIITFLAVDRRLGLICLSFIGFIAALNVFMAFYNSNNLKPITIKAEDAISKTYTEGLMSVQYIRSAFATDIFFDKIKRVSLQNSAVKATSEMGYGLASSIVRILYGISFLILGLTLLKMINNGELGYSIGLGIFISYVAQLGAIKSIGSLTKTIVVNNIRLTDFFKFITNFGKQTYPVLK